MRFLRQNTATRITVGPFLDKTDGITPETGLTATNEHATFTVDDSGTPTLVLDSDLTGSGGNNDFVHITNDDAGFYDLELTAAQTNYVGRAILSINYSTDHLPVFHEFMIVPAMIYDSFFLGTDRLDANVTHIGDTEQTANDNGADINAILADTGTDGVIVASIANNAITSAAINDGAVSDEVWNAATASYGGAGTYGQAVEDIVDDTNELQTDDIPGTLSTIDGKIDTIDGIVDDILVDTAEIGAAGAGLSAVPWNASWDSEVQSEVFDALDDAFTDATGLTANGLLDRIRTIGWILRNKIEVTDSNGNTVIYKDDSSTEAFNVASMLTDDSTTTTRLRAA